MPDLLASTSRHRLRGFRLLLALAFRAAPRQAALLVATQLAAQLAWLAGMYAVKLLVDAVVRGDVAGATRSAVFMAVAEGTSYMCLRMHFIGRELEERASLAVDRRLVALTAGIPGIEHHERPEFAKQLDLLRSQRGLLSGLLANGVGTLRSVVALAGAALLLARISPWLLLLAPIGSVSILSGRWASAIQERAREATVEQSRLRLRLFGIATSASAAKELRVFDLDREIGARHAAATERVDREQLRASWKTGAVWLVANVASAVSLIGAVGFVMVGAIGGTATAGDVVLTMRLAGQLNFAVSTIAGTGDYVMRALKAAGRYFWLADYAAAVSSASAGAPQVPTRLTRGITLEHVSFTYPGTDRRVLDDVSLSIPAGSVVALVGENGAGKTTLVKLLCRFYEPDAGHILVDGVDLRTVDPGAWRDRVTAAFQDFVRFELPVRETVGLGHLPHIHADPHVRDAIDRAAAADVLAALPSGLDTQLGKTWDGGADLSGGQWQKLALARSMMREAPLLTVFDEPTAALDADTEHALFTRVSEAARRAERRGAITLLVSHRFSTVRTADYIVVLDQGRINGQGTHRELMESGGLYAQLYRLQARAYTAPAAPAPQQTAVAPSA